MAGIIVIVFVGWIASATIRTMIESRRAKQIEKIRAEVQRTNRKVNREHYERTSFEQKWAKYQKEAEREQAKLAKEQERQAKEIEKHEAMLRKHEDEIIKLKHRADTAEADIAHWKEHIGSLYALLDIVENNLAGTVNGSKEQMKLQKQVITLNNQIHSAEQRLNKAEFTKSESERKLKEVA